MGEKVNGSEACLAFAIYAPSMDAFLKRALGQILGYPTRPTAELRDPEMRDKRTQYSTGIRFGTCWDRRFVLRLSFRKTPMIAGRPTMLAAITVLVMAILFAVNNVRPSCRTKSNGPENRIGKSGEMKSPGGVIGDRSR